ncbi:MAG TPA: uroporphyrinogen decarboxylase family protein [bacterium]
MKQSEVLPVAIVFHPNWWHKNYGIKFDKSFFFDPEVRVENDRLMRQYLFERFSDLGLGEQYAKSRPVVGGVLLAAGYILSGILGCEIRYFDEAPPEVIPANLTDDQIRELQPPDICQTSIIRDLLQLFDSLERRFGYLEGDINWEGVQNVALNLRGQQFLLDYYMNPDLAKELLDTVFNTIIQFLELIKSKTGTTSISVNRIVHQVDPGMYLHSNCTLTMISANTYRDFLLPYDQMLAERFQPYGIHYCGNDMHKMRNEFAKLEKVSFFDIGWGSDVKLCREALPDKFFSLRLSPERMKSKSAEEIEKDIEDLLQNATPLHKVGLCCINMDYGTPDENVRKIFEVAKRYRNTICYQC